MILRSSIDKYAKNEATKREVVLALLKTDPTNFYSSIIRNMNPLQVTVKENWGTRIINILLVGTGIIFLIFLFSGSKGSAGGLSKKRNILFKKKKIVDNQFPKI